MSGFLKVYKAGQKKDFQLFGNKENYQNGLYIAKKGYLPSFYFFGGAGLGTVTSAKLRTISKDGANIKLNEDGDIVYESEKTINSPSSYISIVQKNNTFEFYKAIEKSISGVFGSLFDIWFTDGFDTFETDIFTADFS
jgi:hypothetical protein